MGTPPEGRYSRDRANPEYWRRNWPIARLGTLLLVIIVIVIVIIAR